MGSRQREGEALLNQEMGKEYYTLAGDEVREWRGNRYRGIEGDGNIVVGRIGLRKGKMHQRDEEVEMEP